MKPGGGGTIVFFAACQSVWLCLSTRFSELFSFILSFLWDIGLKFGIQLCPDIIQTKFDFCYICPTFIWVIVLCKKWVSGLFSPAFCDIDLKFSICICLDIIQINFDFCCVWPKFKDIYIHYRHSSKTNKDATDEGSLDEWVYLITNM